MKHGGKLLVCMMGGLAVCTAASAITPDAETSANPYQSIIDRNVFSLKPPPPPVDPADAAKPTAVKITLTGMTTIFGKARVLMKTAPPPGKPNEGPKSEHSYILTEGERDGDIEVIAIDDKAGSVKVNNAGTIQTLTFEKDGAKLPTTMAPAPAPGAPGAVIPGLPVNRGLPQLPSAGGTTPNFQLPTRIPRVPGGGSQAMNLTPGATGAGVPMVATPGFLPGNTTALPGVQNNAAANYQSPAQAAQQSPPVSLEEQQILIEAARQAGGPTAALLPPTALSPKANVLGPPEPGVPTTTPNQQPQTPTLPIPGRPIQPGPY